VHALLLHATAHLHMHAPARLRVHATAHQHMHAPARLRVHASARLHMRAPARLRVHAPACLHMRAPAHLRVHATARLRVHATAHLHMRAPARLRVHAPARLHMHATAFFIGYALQVVLVWNAESSSTAAASAARRFAQGIWESGGGWSVARNCTEGLLKAFGKCNYLCWFLVPAALSLSISLPTAFGGGRSGWCMACAASLSLSKVSQYVSWIGSYLLQVGTPLKLLSQNTAATWAAL